MRRLFLAIQGRLHDQLLMQVTKKFSCSLSLSPLAEWNMDGLDDIKYHREKRVLPEVAPHQGMAWLKAGFHGQWTVSRNQKRKAL